MATHQTLQPDRKDKLLSLLADDRRRAILTYLREAPSDVATVEMLTDEIDKEDHGGDGSNAIVLVHSDLPRLDEGGLIEFDKQSMTVRYQSIPVVEQLLDCIDEV